MFRRFLALLAALMLPILSMAEDTPVYQVYTFSGSLPEQLKEPLAALIPDADRILSGAAIQHCSSHTDAAPSHPDTYSALLLAETDDGLRLYAAACPENLPWQVNDYTHLLRDYPNVSIGIYQPEATRIPNISVDYYTASGLISDMIEFWNNQLWRLAMHINQPQSVTVVNKMGMIAIKDKAGQESFRCASPFFLDYLTDISALPASREEARAQTWLPVYAPYSAGMLLYCTGANLRREPTSKSESLGQYAPNTAMVFTGEQKQGTSWPWYQVRIGNTIGWMSGNYVSDEAPLDFAPLPMGRTMTDSVLFSAPDDSQPLLQLKPGVTFHILAEYKGMYHICIPQQDISWAMEPEGTYGYISPQNILTGAGISALDALEGHK